MIYFDHNATTPIDDRVVEAMQPYLTRFFGNASNLYRLGRAARAAVDFAREQVAAPVGVDPEAVIFTSGGTESNNLAIKGAAWAMGSGSLAIGATEHPAVTEPAGFLRAYGWRLETLGATTEGVIRADALVSFRSSRLRLASVMWANNETGVINDIPAIAAEARRCGALFHTDAVQAAGRLPLDFPSSGAHLMSLSSHKLFGPKGAGALIIDRSVRLIPLLHGGGQEHGLRGGTENVPAIIGFGRAAELARQELEHRFHHTSALRRRLEVGLRGLPAVTVFAEHTERLPNTVQFALDGYDGEMLVMLLDREGFAVSSRAACGSGLDEPSPVLLAMGVEAEVAKGAIRVSFGPGNSELQVDHFLEVLRGLMRGDGRSLPARN